MEKPIDGKKCNKCEEIKSLDSFYFRKDSGKYRPDCKQCRNSLNTEQKKAKREYNKSYWQKNKENEQKRYQEWYDKNYDREGFSSRRRKNHYKKYGLTVDEYIQMYTEQDHKCKICKKPETVLRNGKIKRLAIDHCHDTGKVRGLLCQNCNRGIGLLKDDITVLRSAIEYLKEHKDD